MRIGEIKKILDPFVEQSGRVFQVKNVKQAWGGQAYEIGSAKEFSLALDLIMNQKGFSSISSANVQAIQESLSTADFVTLSQAEYSNLNSYIQQINQGFPVFYATLENFVEPQDAQVVNIKLPNGINSLDSLIDVNERIRDVLKKYNIDGQFDFVGFDKGSSWLVVITGGLLSYNSLIAGINIAEKYFKAREAYYKSETARAEYVAATEKKDPTKHDVDKYIERRLQGLIKDEVSDVVEKIGFAGTKAETISKVVIATKELIKELDSGTEFHLSLNPPVYLSEGPGGLKIDYNSIPKINEGSAVKQLEAVKQDDNEN